MDKHTERKVDFAIGLWIALVAFGTVAAILLAIFMS